MLTLLEATDFRCLEHARLEPDAHLNLIYGLNASGKTSLLEAIFCLGRGRSFRTHQANTLIRDGASAFRVVGKVEDGGRSIPVGLEHRPGKTTARCGGEPVPSLAALAEALPVQVIDPEVHDLVEEGPGGRRQYLDWGVFHVEPTFLDTWRRYQRALRQRNAGLRAQQSPASLVGWDEQMIATAQIIDEQRQAYLADLATYIADIGEQLLGMPLDVQYQAGWPTGKSFQQALSDNARRDREQGSTSVGPHRANLVVRLDDRKARSRASRGQQKLLGAGLVLAQLRLLYERKGRSGVMLLDDPSAELDNNSLRGLLAAVSSQQTQLFITALGRDVLPVTDWPAMFHVEQGKVQKVV